jgi:DNA-binding PadR family transcriptional regulator
MNLPDESYINYLPLREPTFFILLSLVPGMKHGYAILSDVEKLSQGKVNLSTGTLYEALARLLDQGLIERIREEKAEVDNNRGEMIHRGPARKAYGLTKVGHRIIEAEIQRMHSLIKIAQNRLDLKGQEG